MTRLTLATLAAVAIVVVARRTRVRDEVEDDAGDLREFARHGAVIARRRNLSLTPEMRQAFTTKVEGK